MNMHNKSAIHNFKVVDLFSGCGGLSFGFVQQGFDVVAGVDNWKDSLVTFEHNHPGAKGILMDLGSFDPKELKRTVGKIDVVIGGPPCQGFSISGKRNPDDPRNGLYASFVRTVAELKPNAFVLENVPNLIAMSGGIIKDQIIKDFTSFGYEVKYKVMLASDYGVPQNRRRVVFVGVLGRNSFEFPEPMYADSKSKVTASQALSDLPEESVMEGTENKKKPSSDYQAMMRRKTNKIFNHEITNHDRKTIETIALVPDGGNYKNLPAHLQRTRRVNIAWTRLSSTKPSFTIDTGHRHHFHYKHNRIPTVRESARLQSFPDDFVFMGSKTSQYKQVGNAVPPLMSEVIAAELKRVLLNG